MELLLFDLLIEILLYGSGGFNIFGVFNNESDKLNEIFLIIESYFEFDLFIKNNFE